MSSLSADKLRQAFGRLNAGDLAGAKRLCGEVLREAPHHPDALHLMGVVRLAGGDASEAASEPPALEKIRAIHHGRTGGGAPRLEIMSGPKRLRRRLTGARRMDRCTCGWGFRWHRKASWPSMTPAGRRGALPPTSGVNLISE